MSAPAFRDRWVAERQHCQSLAVLALQHLYVHEEKSDDPEWLKDRLTELADYFEADLRCTGKGRR